MTPPQHPIPETTRNRFEEILHAVNWFDQSPGDATPIARYLHFWLREAAGVDGAGSHLSAPSCQDAGAYIKQITIGTLAFIQGDAFDLQDDRCATYRRHLYLPMPTSGTSRSKMIAAMRKQLGDAPFDEVATSGPHPLGSVFRTQPRPEAEGRPISFLIVRQQGSSHMTHFGPCLSAMDEGQPTDVPELAFLPFVGGEANRDVWIDALHRWRSSRHEIQGPVKLLRVCFLPEDVGVIWNFATELDRLGAPVPVMASLEPGSDLVI